MSPLLRDVLICLLVAVALQFLLIGPLLTLMLLTGGAIFALPVIAFCLAIGLALDHFAVRGNGTQGWPLTAAALGLVLNVVFGVLTSYGYGP